MKCNAKTRSGKPCQKFTLTGKARCRLHGGLSLSGQNHPNYKHGRRSNAYLDNARRVRAELKFLEQLGKHHGWFLE